MEWLNYHHLLYFWAVAKEGGVAAAGLKLKLSHPTISTQIRTLETRLGEKLFRRDGRRLALTEVGEVVYRYADEIFSLGREMVDAVRGRPTGRPLQLRVGIADAVPKLIARKLLEPAQRLKERPHFVCSEDKHERLVASLASHSLDVVISGAPAGPGVRVRAFNHELGACGVSFFAHEKLKPKLKKDFPSNLDMAPMLVPTEDSSMRRALEKWFESLGIRPSIVGEFEDSALMKVFGQSGLGVFPAPTVIEAEVSRQHQVKVLGRTEAVRETYWAISVERRLRHPAVVAICEAARGEVFSPKSS